MPNLAGAADLGRSLPLPDAPKANIHPENQELWDELLELQGSNEEIEGQLAGYAVQMDPLSVLQTRLVALLEVLYPPETPEGQRKQIEVEMRHQAIMSGVLHEARRNVVKAQLAAGGRVPPGMLEEVARAHGQAIPRGFGG
jgi:hypothetical protein